MSDIQEDISIIQGTAGEDPPKPDVPSDTHYLIRYITVTAAGEIVDPDTGTGVTDVQKLYSEIGTEAGGESDVTVSTARIVVNSPNTPLPDAVSIEATDVQQLDAISFKYAELQSVATKTHFNFKLKLKSAVPTDKYWFVRFYNGTTNFRSYLFKHGQNGFNAGNLNLQYISIPKELIDLTDDYDKIDLFFFHRLNSIPGYFIDDVEWINGFSTPIITSPILSTKQLFTAAAAQTIFTLSNSPNNVDVVVDRVPQIEGVDYILSGNTVTMTEGLELNSKVQIRKY